MKKTGNILIILFFMFLLSCKQKADKEIKSIYNDQSPSKSIYFSWINDTWEGSNEAQTLANIGFFKWMHDEYGMDLDIYLLDAGNIDHNGYGSYESNYFKQQFPNGLGPIVKSLQSFGSNLGMWLGPDGYGNTTDSIRAREELLVSLCREYDVKAFKLDAAASSIGKGHQAYFIEAMQKSRKYVPDMIVMNERLSEMVDTNALDQCTTFLWESRETYIDVLEGNPVTAPHHRAHNVSRGLTPDLGRLFEDCGICLSSCLDYWDDDLVLQAFNRNLILSPEIYGNPWLLGDDEFPKLARIFNLHKKFNKIMVNGIVLPEAQYGKYAVSRGDSDTRIITFRNMSWQPVRYRVDLDNSIGLSEGDNIELRQFHPGERIIGNFRYGQSVDVEVQPFRACLLMATTTDWNEPGIIGCDYEVVRDVKGKPVIINLLATSGATATIELKSGKHHFRTASIDGNPANGLISGEKTTITFPGKIPGQPYQRFLAALKPGKVPPDANDLYEADCFAADNNPLEVRSLYRSGETKIPQVKNARDAFFNDTTFIHKGIWDKNLFDGDMNTFLKLTWDNWPARICHANNGGSLRINPGEQVFIDSLVLKGTDVDYNPVLAEVSADMKTWTKAVSKNVNGIWVISIPANKRIAYIRTQVPPKTIAEIEGYFKSKALDRSKWKVTNLFAYPSSLEWDKAWTGSFKLDEFPKGSYLAIAVNGEYADESMYAAIRVNGNIIGAPDRALSYTSNTWEQMVIRLNNPVFTGQEIKGNYTYYFPLEHGMVDQNIEAYVIGIKGEVKDVKPEVWITAYPVPYEKKTLVLTD